jgi:hypothetical protein
MTHAHPAPKKQHLVIRSHTLTRDTDRSLQQTSRDASVHLGWTVSSSAVLRALLRYAAQQPASWGPTALFPLVEREIATGVAWGSKKK